VPFHALLAAALTLVLGLGGPSPSHEPVRYTPPVDAPVVDRFRPPPTPYAAGNRGIDYDTDVGQPVRAAAPGEVVFAGAVGRTRHVVVLHADGLRTSYSFLLDVLVRRGQRVDRGAVVGTAADRLHFGVRTADDAYLDPLAVLGVHPPLHPRLVRDDGHGPPGGGGRRPAYRLADERQALVRFLRAHPPTGRHRAPA
jgi:murein DD-endopeptidase MepM/ murein hydrolase activator NlpD